MFTTIERNLAMLSPEASAEAVAAHYTFPATDAPERPTGAIVLSDHRF